MSTTTADAPRSLVNPSGVGVAAVAADAAIDAGADEAVRRDQRLLLLVPPGTAPVRVRRALRRARVRAPGLRVAAVREPECRTVCARRPGVLVLEPSDVTTALLDEEGPPLLVVPPGDHPEGPVVLGLAPWTGDDVVAAAVRQARARNTGLRVLRIWSDSDPDPGLVRTPTLRRWDRHDEALRNETRRRLAPWLREGEPEPQVQVVRDDTAEALALFTGDAGLLVVGHRGGRRAAAGPLLALARLTSRPLLIVPDLRDPDL